SCGDSSEQQPGSEKPSDDSSESVDGSVETDVETSSPPQHVIETTAQPQVATGGKPSTSIRAEIRPSALLAASNPGAAGAALAVAPAKCSSTPSTYHEESQFNIFGNASRWTLNRASSQPGTSFTTTKRGPISNPGLCADGCALLAFTIPAGEGWGGGAIIDEWFAASTNLNGATVVAKMALEVSRPHLPVNVRVYAQGDAASNYAWGTTASVSSATLSDVSRFHEVVLRPSSRRGNNGFCAANVGAIGIQVQRTRTTTDEIPVKLYVKSVVVGQTLSSAVDAGHDDAGANQGRTAQKSGLGAANRRFGSDGYCELAKDGAISVASDDWVAAGTCQGYGYTYAQGNRADTKVVPKCDGSRCVPALSRISASGLCANGTIAADPSWKSKVGLGFDFDPSKARSSGVALTYHMAGTAILRLQLADTKGNYYCADLDETDDYATTIQLPWEFLTTRCWDRWDPGVAYNPAWPIQGLQLVASCRADKNSWFDMCLMGLATF
ncbi:MAG: hypothetical protein ACM3ZE_31670, partial [Myxococcales bacterium]